MLQRWSQTHLAEAAGVSIRTIQKLEAGEPPARLLGRIEAALGWPAGRAQTILEQGVGGGPKTGLLVRADGSQVPVAFLATIDPMTFLAVSRTGERLGLDHGDALHIDGTLGPGQSIEIDGADTWSRS